MGTGIRDEGQSKWQWKDEGTKAELRNREEQGRTKGLRAMRIRAGPCGEGCGRQGGPRLLELLGQRGDVLHAVLVCR